MVTEVAKTVGVKLPNGDCYIIFRLWFTTV